MDSRKKFVSHVRVAEKISVTSLKFPTIAAIVVFKSVWKEKLALDCHCEALFKMPEDAPITYKWRWMLSKSFWVLQFVFRFIQSAKTRSRYVQIEMDAYRVFLSSAYCFLKARNFADKKKPFSLVFILVWWHYPPQVILRMFSFWFKNFILHTVLSRFPPPWLSAHLGAS